MKNGVTLKMMTSEAEVSKGLTREHLIKIRSGLMEFRERLSNNWQQVTGKIELINELIKLFPDPGEESKQEGVNHG